MKATVICDGRGNAGTGARATCLQLPDGRWNDRAEQLAPTTNIVAEHLSIQLGLELALQHGVTELLVLNDSLSPVNHVLGTYQCRQPHLKPILQRTRELWAELETVTIRWVPRAETKRADRLCREIDKSPRPNPRGTSGSDQRP